MCWLLCYHSAAEKPLCSRQENDSVNRFQILFSFRYSRCAKYIKVCMVYLKLHFPFCDAYFQFPPKTIRVFQYPPQIFATRKIAEFTLPSNDGILKESIGSKTSKSYQYLEREFWRILPASKVRFGIDTENHHRSDGNHMMCPTYYFSMATIQERQHQLQTTQ